MIYAFEIKGNHKNIKGNPLAYKRATFQGKYKPEIRDYHEWKNFIVESFWTQVHNKYSQEKPFDKPRGKVTLDIQFGPETHPDSDNVVKGILDSLFVNDKEIDVETRHTCRNPQPLMKIKIEIYG